MKDIIESFYPEMSAGGFTRKDGTIQFYQRIQALLRPGDAVLDFGAGRGAAHYVDGSHYRQHLRDLRGAGRRVVGADVDPVVTTNPTVDEAVVIEPESSLPFADEAFNVIVSDSTFEHIADAAKTAAELDRVLKPGGWLCVRTPNRNGYVAWANRILRGQLAKRMVLAAQPYRKAEDVFPAHYRMNAVRSLKQLFPSGHYRHVIFAIDSEPCYHFDNRLVFTMMLAVHGVTPPSLRNTLLCFLQKGTRRSS